MPSGKFLPCTPPPLHPPVTPLTPLPSWTFVSFETLQFEFCVQLIPKKLENNLKKWTRPAFNGPITWGAAHRPEDSGLLPRRHGTADPSHRRQWTTQFRLSRRNEDPPSHWPDHYLPFKSFRLLSNSKANFGTFNSTSKISVKFQLLKHYYQC